MTKRSIVSLVLLMIFTFGIYALYWYFKFHSEIREASGEGASGGLHFLGLFTFGIYPIYWVYKTSKRIARLGGEDNAVLNLVLCFICGIVSYCLMQNEVNKLIDNRPL